MKNGKRKPDIKEEDTQLLVATLPAELQQALQTLPVEEFIEVVMDLGRPP